ncbi:hypothetical protein N657DRAFT_92335 [Parathielavia appendiculata]|uniref:Uncharacterized protein n=1 Tax=Parathielavia appendiculata TaxID=2587402 RepID=A0AAN6Z983_9PEZI|nr:hypothetical protein N657DRAFT_92335 [Parathielavia appendiculata]
MCAPFLCIGGATRFLSWLRLQSRRAVPAMVTGLSVHPILFCGSWWAHRTHARLKNEGWPASACNWDERAAILLRLSCAWRHGVGRMDHFHVVARMWQLSFAWEPRVLTPWFQDFHVHPVGLACSVIGPKAGCHVRHIPSRDAPNWPEKPVELGLERSAENG